MQRVLRPRCLGVAVLGAISLLALPPRRLQLCAAEETPAEALRNLMSAALSAAKEHDQAKLEAVARGLQIPNYETWFKATFGEEEGTKLAASYAANMDKDEKDFPRLVQGMAEHEGELLVEDAREPKTSVGNFCGRALIKSAKNEASFYSVNLEWVSSKGERKWFGAGYFTLVDGAYRRLNCASLGLFGPIRVGGNVQNARTIKKVPPVYPVEAQQAGISARDYSEGRDS